MKDMSLSIKAMNVISSQEFIKLSSIEGHTSRMITLLEDVTKGIKSFKVY
jgi:hypothetical protein